MPSDRGDVVSLGDFAVTTLLELWYVGLCVRPVLSGTSIVHVVLLRPARVGVYLRDCFVSCSVFVFLQLLYSWEVV